jgi:hypothetical protein
MLSLHRRAALLIGLACFLGFHATAAPLEKWLYCAQNLWVDKNIAQLEALFDRAARAGYTHVLLTDSKFSKLGEMDARYFRNVERVKKTAAAAKLELVPALFSIGYSNDLLWHDPNLIEALPVRDALFAVRNGEARLQPDPEITLKGGDFTDLKKWSWKDPGISEENGTARLDGTKGGPIRLVQKIMLHPFRQYHLSVDVKTENFRGTPEAKVLAGNSALNYNSLGTKATQDWTTHHVVFNSLSNNEASLYLGCWNPKGGVLWWKNAQLQEIGLVNLVRRPGAPLTVRTEDNKELTEGKDFEPVRDLLMGTKPWKGSYDIYHEPPVIKTSLPDGARLRVSYYHGVTVHDDQANICPSEPRTIELLRDQARRMHKTWGAKGYMMSHDEIRVLNWCAACQKRNLDAGAILADNVKTCARILREVNPGGNIYVWSDMFDPNHNAHKNYYLVRGDLSNSWEGLDKDVIIVPWYFEKRKQSLEFFANRGHRQVIAGYYDHSPEQVTDWLQAACRNHKPEQVTDWLQAAQAVRGVLAVMYTTWQHKYDDMERFAELIKN